MKRYSLENRESNKLVRILQILFGIACIITAGWWAVYMIKSLESGNYWIATLFMFFFGAFQIYSGLGYASKYLIIGKETLKIKKAAIGREQLIRNSDIERIDILPLSISVTLRNGKTFNVSFPVTLNETIDRVKDAIEEFGRDNKILTEEKREGK
jgi:uncharacterized protein YlzI (FlbEa/FlbD family)